MEDYIRHAYPNELMHHGVKGMHWGIRRYQNYDGSLTYAGQKRYGDDRSRKDYLDKIGKRGNLNRREAAVCAKIGESMYDKAKKVEPGITRDVKSAVANADCEMYGLEHRLKTADSIASKIGADSKSEGINFNEASKNINDTIRYTAILDTKNFVNSYNSIKDSLKQQGYTEVKCKNYWQDYAEGKVLHKSVQSVFKNKEGNRFELQFQTKESQHAKDLKVPLYDERRQLGITADRARELESQMRDLAEKVPNPPGISKIKSK